MPQRQGAAIALNYLSRVYLRDPSDALPGAGRVRTVDAGRTRKPASSAVQVVGGVGQEPRGAA